MVCNGIHTFKCLKCPILLLFFLHTAVVDFVIQILALVFSDGFAVGVCRMYIMYVFFCQGGVCGM